MLFTEFSTKLYGFWVNVAKRFYYNKLVKMTINNMEIL